jgi:heme/copper-type cytochrome/quinol oxidase subunit 3
MTDIPAQTSPQAGVQAEDEAYYHESGLNATWTGSRLAIGGLTFLYACFAFAYFYLRSINSAGRWQGSGFIQPSVAIGTVIMILAVLSAFVNYYGLQRIKAGHKSMWQISGLVALLLGLAAVAMQIDQLLNLPFPPGSSGFSSVFTGFYPVFLTSQLAVLVWLEILLARSRFIPAMSFVEQPPTYAETQAVQRFQASLSAFSTVWAYMALVAFLFWLLFYAL